MLKPTEIRKALGLSKTLVPFMYDLELNEFLLVLYRVSARVLKEHEEVERLEKKKLADKRKEV